MNQHYPLLISSACVCVVLLLTVFILAVKLYRANKKDIKQRQVKSVLNSLGFDVKELQLN